MSKQNACEFLGDVAALAALAALLYSMTMWLFSSKPAASLPAPVNANLEVRVKADESCTVNHKCLILPAKTFTF